MKLFTHNSFNMACGSKSVCILSLLGIMVVVPLGLYFVATIIPTFFNNRAKLIEEYIFTHSFNIGIIRRLPSGRMTVFLTSRRLLFLSAMQIKLWN